MGMNKCPVLEQCRFFNNVLENMPAISESLMEQYCLGDNTECARFFIFDEIGKEHLPDDVFPHEMEKAKKLVRNFRHYGKPN
jgi:UTP-glucose-1-phosphate uridylyltransferase